MISIHSLAWRKTSHIQRDSFAQRDFNPLSRMEKDCMKYEYIYVLLISIHSLAWRKTLSVLHCLMHLLFQSTLSHGERLIGGLAFYLVKVFQSTLSHGERLSCTCHSCRNKSISIHSLAWRKTSSLTEETVMRGRFQSTLSHGERHVIKRYPHSMYDFNPLSRMEKDRSQRWHIYRHCNFNPLSRMEKDLHNYSLSQYTDYFNPLSRMEKDLYCL